MENKEMNQQESLDLISRMIKQTNNHMALGAGNTFIAWGLVLFLVSIAANITIFVTKNPIWIWLYMAIPVLGFPIDMFIQRHAKQKDTGHVKTYIEDSLDKVWKAIGLHLIAYPIIVMLLEGVHGTSAWIGMFFLGMFLPALGTYISAIFLKKKSLEFLAGIACMLSLLFLCYSMQNGFHFNLPVTWQFPLCALFSLVFPGSIINRMAEEENK